MKNLLTSCLIVLLTLSFFPGRLRAQSLAEVSSDFGSAGSDFGTAEDTSSDETQVEYSSGGSFEPGLVPCSGVDCGWDDLFTLFNNVLQLFIYLASFAGGIAISWVGILFLFYSTNEQKRTEAKSLLWRMVIGFAVVLGAALLVQTAMNWLVKPEALTSSTAWLAPIAHADTVGGTVDYGIINPLKVDSIKEFIVKILELLYQILLPIVALYIMYAGFLYVSARGNKDKLTRAHNALLYSLLGASLVLGAFVIVKIIEGTIKSLQ